LYVLVLGKRKVERKVGGLLAPTEQRQQQVMLYEPYSGTVFGNFHGFIVTSQQLGQIPISLVVVSSSVEVQWKFSERETLSAIRVIEHWPDQPSVFSPNE
jgi:hypothetical protein